MLIFSQCRIFPAQAGCWTGPRTVEEAEDLIKEKGPGFAQEVINNITVSDIVSEMIGDMAVIFLFCMHKDIFNFVIIMFLC